MWAVLRKPGWGRYVRADEKLNFFRSRPAIPSGNGQGADFEGDGRAYSLGALSRSRGQDGGSSIRC